jgi:lipoyl-dependent peroxiredoxin
MAEPLARQHGDGPTRIERCAHVLWIHGEQGGAGHVRGRSRAFSALPLSLTRDRSGSRCATTPGELLAAAHSASFAVTLADLLDHRGTPARELGVEATCELAEEGHRGRRMRTARLRVSGRCGGLDQDAFRSAPTPRSLFARSPVP